MTEYVNWATEAAEARKDWAEAKRCWYYAAQQSMDGDLRAFYDKREDAAEQLRWAEKESKAE